MNTILKNNIVILHCANWLLEILYQYLDQVKSSKKCSINDPIRELVDSLNQGVYGWGNIQIELSDHIASDQEYFQFQQLVLQAIENIGQKGTLHPDALALLNRFATKIVS